MILIYLLKQFIQLKPLQYKKILHYFIFYPKHTFKYAILHYILSLKLQL